MLQKRQYCTPNNHLSEEFYKGGSKHLDLQFWKKEKQILKLKWMNWFFFFCVFEVQCDINCDNDTVDCLAKKVPSNQKLDMALGVLLGLLWRSCWSSHRGMLYYNVSQWPPLYFSLSIICLLRIYIHSSKKGIFCFFCVKCQWN